MICKDDLNTECKETQFPMICKDGTIKENAIFFQLPEHRMYFGCLTDLTAKQQLSEEVMRMKSMILKCNQ